MIRDTIVPTIRSSFRGAMTEIGGFLIPRFGLIALIKVPNSDDYLEDEDIERPEDTKTWGFDIGVYLSKRYTGDTLAAKIIQVRAATGWTTGNGWETAGNPLYWDDGTSRTAWATEIAAWIQANEWCVFFQLISAELQKGILAVYDPSIMTLSYAEKIADTLGVNGFLARTLLWGAYQADPETSKSGPDIDWAYTYPIPSGDGTTITSGLPIDQSDAQRGLHCGPGYTQMVKNSKFIGAVSGSPGTAPTNWTRYNSVGTLVVNGEGSLTITANSERVHMGQSISVTAGSSLYVRVSIKVENGYSTFLPYYLYAVSLPTDTIKTYYIDGVEGTTLPTGTTVSCLMKLTFVNSGAPIIQIGPGTTSNITSVVTLSNIFASQLKNAPYVATGVDQTITLGSCVGSASGGARWSMSSATDSNNIALAETFRGEPDGVELYANHELLAMNSGTVTVVSPGVFDVTGTGVASGGRFVYGTQGALFPSGYRRILTCYIAITTGTPCEIRCYSSSFVLTASIVVPSSGLYKIECPGDTGYYYFGINGSMRVSNISIQKLQPAVGCVAALVTMGVGSADLTADQYFGVISANNTAYSVLYTGKQSGVLIPSKSYDKTAAVTVPSTAWQSLGVNLLFVEFVGSKYRAGFYRIGVDSAPVYSHTGEVSTWGSFDGSFNPLTALIAAYGSTVQIWLKSVGAWKNRIPTFDELKKSLEEINA